MEIGDWAHSPIPIEYTYYPQKCKSGQLCLLGIKTSITNEKTLKQLFLVGQD